MRGVISIATLSLITLGVTSQMTYAQLSSSDFDAITASFDESFEALRDESQSTMERIEAKYDLLQSQIEEEYSQFKRDVCDTWGEEVATVGDRYRWVEYGDDKLSRSIVDFESGEVEIELLLSDEELKDEALVESKVRESMSRLCSSKGSSVEYDSKYVERVEMSSKPIMDEIYDIRSTSIERGDNRATTTTTKSSSPNSTSAELEREVIRLREEQRSIQPQSPTPTPKTIEAEAEPKPEPKPEPQIAASTKIQTEPTKEIKRVQTASGDRNVVSIKSNLKVGYLGDLAKRYESVVIANAERFNLSPTLIFAVMETESYFNPTATSHIPAYGLMQIVPKYAGRDVYRHLYGEDKILSKNYLYQAEKNVEIGAGYLHLLSTRYFSGVTDPQSRELCMIAAYNTGAGNVSRAIMGHTNIYKSIPKINSMEYNELYNYLRKNLPYEETRNYIERVTTKQTKYIAK